MKTEDKLHNEMERMGLDLETLANDARALMSATSHVAGEKVENARRRLEEVLGSGEDIYEGLRDRALRGARIASETVREHTYSAIGIAIGTGLLLGLLAAHRSPARCS